MRLPRFLKRARPIHANIVRGRDLVTQRDESHPRFSLCDVVKLEVSLNFAKPERDNYPLGKGLP